MGSLSTQLALLALLLSVACAYGKKGTPLDILTESFGAAEPAPIPQEFDTAHVHSVHYGDATVELCFRETAACADADVYNFVDYNGQDFGDYLSVDDDEVV
jgi:hypothetical protein